MKYLIGLTLFFGFNCQAEPSLEEMIQSIGFELSFDPRLTEAEKFAAVRALATTGYWELYNIGVVDTVIDIVRVETFSTAKDSSSLKLAGGHLIYRQPVLSHCGSLF